MRWRGGISAASEAPKEARLAARVKTHYFSSFNMPRSCVVCGNPPGQGMSWKVSGSKSNWSGKQTTTLSLEFPLCEECHAVRRGLVHRCVRVSGFKTPGLFDKQGWIVFNFENPSFAAEFSTMNLGVAV